MSSEFSVLNIRLLLATGSFGICLAIAYLSVHSGMVLLGWRRAQGLKRILSTNLLLIACFVALLLGATSEWRSSGWLRFLRLWSPVIFFWWAYLWAGHTLHLFYPPGVSFDSVIIRWEKRFLGQPSLWWARNGSRWLTEVLHFFYASYYFYTPVLGIYLYAQGRFNEFEAMTFAVMLGYAVGYSLSPIFPVWGPRWGLVAAGLLESSQQKLRGYWVTHSINFIMYGGTAHKGAAMPSGHSSTAVVFLFWCYHLWGLWVGIPASIVVLAMGAGSVYGRYHYIADILCGAALGALSVWFADWLILDS
ncbi:MAG: phosphatase PAP2 family protein [Acidobacteria bacterium]|nr:phosphatase PAP2 family protein [Acidobacteriota bacterium]MCZ6768989.1 phosphatase PAP2 family protein [Acidobacteriota bacterium]MCZ6878931.1 phosphatase PAP2 family protein [Acidobacteriota bacterium]